MTLTARERQDLLVQCLTEHMLGKLTQGQLLKYLRKNILRVNQDQYAQLVEISRRTLSDIERDAGSPTQAVIDKVFKPFGLRSGLIPVHAQIAQALLSGEYPKKGQS